MAQGQEALRGDVQTQENVSHCWPKVPSRSVPPACLPAWSVHTTFVLCISINSRTLLSQIKVKSRAAESRAFALMLSSFFPNGGPQSSDSSNVRRGDGTDLAGLHHGNRTHQELPRMLVAVERLFLENLRSSQPQRGLFLFVLSSRAFAENDEISRHFLLNLHKLWCGDCRCHHF